MSEFAYGVTPTGTNTRSFAELHIISSYAHLLILINIFYAADVPFGADQQDRGRSSRSWTRYSTRRRSRRAIVGKLARRLLLPSEPHLEYVMRLRRRRWALLEGHTMSLPFSGGPIRIQKSPVDERIVHGPGLKRKRSRNQMFWARHEMPHLVYCESPQFPHIRHATRDMDGPGSRGVRAPDASRMSR